MAQALKLATDPCPLLCGTHPFKPVLRRKTYANVYLCMLMCKAMPLMLKAKTERRIPWVLP